MSIYNVGYREESIKGVSNFTFINHKFKGNCKQICSKTSKYKTIFKEEILCKDTSDTLLVTNSAKKLIKYLEELFCL